MPELNTRLHLSMLRDYAFRRRLARGARAFRSGGLRAARAAFSGPAIYGLQWGDPERNAPLRAIRDRFLLPYCDPAHTALEIGPGGGRWTRYLLGFSRLYVVDYHEELLRELQKNFAEPNMVFVKNNGTDFPGVADESVDYVFTFGTFVHLEPDLIDAYLLNLRRVLKIGANVVIQYSDKTKTAAQQNDGFSDNDPDRMCGMITRAGYRIVEEDRETLPHSSVVRFTP
jgi:ubiquinone/menaquinone biosynthesis C-methylase UbiE